MRESSQSKGAIQMTDAKTEYEREKSEKAEEFSAFEKSRCIGTNSASYVIQREAFKAGYDAALKSGVVEELVEAIREVLSNCTMADKYVRCCKQSLTRYNALIKEIENE